MPYGIVKEKRNDLAVVIMERQDMCGDCHACEMLSGKKKCMLTCKDHVDAKVGERVEVSLGTEHFLKATYIMYGLPLVGFVAGMVTSFGITQLLAIEEIDLWVASGALIGAALGLYYIKWRDKKKVYHKYLPHIIAKVKKG